MTGRLDPDRLARLEEERDLLLRSIEDLDEELAAGDIDEADHRVLRDDYVARAAAVLRSIDSHTEEMDRAAPSRSSLRLALTVVGVVAVTAVVGVLLARSVGARGVGEVATGTDGSVRSRLAACQPLAFGEPEEGVECYQDILDDQPDHIEAVTYQGWAHYRAGDTDAAADRYEQAIALDATYPDVRVFTAIAHKDDGDFEAAQAELDVFFSLDPPPGVQSTLTQLGLDAEIAYGLLAADTQECWELARVAAEALAAGAGEAGGSGEAGGDDEAPDVVTAIGEALGCLGAVLNDRPDDVDALLARAYLLAISGGSQLATEARTSLDAILAIDPAEPTALLMGAALANVEGDPQRALADLEAFEATGARPSPLYPLAEPEALRRQIEAAI